ncbi:MULTISPECIES: class I SAM-dependent RNA methyltransferase [unclassified Apibacter]|uniref:THUMP domain-containing class I SAM-dependent RNA methyltransferase n=1 Tax=unclassified Apibacter TaxID=2630820 RepID=UPI001323099C|nr:MULTISPECIES: THUMP domain-containing protein [unclassified Apibacter]MCX8676340.1 class I SAM-dependent RNA methyltransferase [Apibacter sp. B3919]MXO23805.1 class I SAM-dependent RNA methyltransferase [Apibacter sp. B3924]MXO26517.1 class I SAM-dependent RNA methyltransferase [Apibacter sp. B3813]MXO28469.1 class I SAM-dependent RNA methyltransferase [Apibacter sp. B3913]MXO30423.1 class I SAM-dependent RNA methyltransferase [Apibacter sp. B3912]
MFANNDSFTMQAKTFYGLEDVLVQELKQLGASQIVKKNRAVEFLGDLGFLYKANYSLRTALKILVPIHHFKAKNETIFEKEINKIPWENYFFNSQSFAIDATVYSDYFKHSQYIMLKMKDGIVDRFRKKFGKRPDIERFHPDIKFHLHISNQEVTISLDSSGDPLFKRGYRKSHFEAPINEVLAAGLLNLAGWDGKGNFLDPMCGSGTLLVEAAMIALNMPPQLHRKQFGFMNWKNFDLELFNKIKDTRINRIKDFSGKIVGYDISDKALVSAKNNIEAADLSEFIELKNQDFFTSQKELFPLLVVFNPPYDERLSITTDHFYKNIGDTLKNNYKNTLAWFITSDLEAYKKIGLRPSRKIKIYNGKLECRFFQYDIYEGSKKIR